MTIDDLYNLIKRHTHDGIETKSLVLKGSAAPTFKPRQIGLIYCDSVNGKVYISTNTSTSSDWKVLN